MISEACSHFQMHKCGEINFSSRPKKLNRASTLNMLSNSFSVKVLLLHQNSLTSPRAQVNQVERWRQAVGFTEVSTYETWIPYFIHVSSRGGLM